MAKKTARKSNNLRGLQFVFDFRQETNVIVDSLVEPWPIGLNHWKQLD